MASEHNPAPGAITVLVTGAAGQVGAIGPKIINSLLKQNFAVRAMVRKDDERANALRDAGAQVVVGDLTNSADVVNALAGCRRVYFSMSVSEYYLEASLIMAAAAKEQGDIEVLVNMSQMTVSEMTLSRMTNSRQQRLHWLSEQAFNWSGLPVVHIRPTVFMDSPFFSQWAAHSINNSSELRLPFGTGKSSPIASDDVAAVAVSILSNPVVHIGKVYKLTGPVSQDFHGIAREYSAALGKEIKYVDLPFDEWSQQVLGAVELPSHVRNHLREMAMLHSQNRYDRYTNEVKAITGKDPVTIEEYVRARSHIFKKSQL